MKICPLNTNIDIELIKIAADKSISHRFVIFSLLCEDKSIANNYLLAEDTLNTLELAKKLGAIIELDNDIVSIKAPKMILSPNSILECGNSGTLIRLMLGFLSACDGFFVLSGDKYLNSRPMKRITDPLKNIGALIYGRNDANLAPLCIKGSQIKAFNYESKISSAQVKTALILAAFKADSISYFKEPILSRDHSERMLLAMDAPLKISNNGTNIEILPLTKPLKALNINIPNDPSSAFYFALATVILPNSKIILKNITLNPTRIEAYEVLKKMGANIEFKNIRNDFEPIGDIVVKSSKLNSIDVKENISWLIDEAPALAIAFAFANGVSTLRNAKELRVKESDRIKAIVSNLNNFNIKAKEFDDGFEIIGNSNNIIKQNLIKIKSFGDHRIAMSFAILGLKLGVEIDDYECINTSFPNFLSILQKIGAKIEK